VCKCVRFHGPTYASEMCIYVSNCPRPMHTHTHTHTQEQPHKRPAHVLKATAGVCTLGAIAAWLKLGWVGWYVCMHSHPCIHERVYAYVHTWIDTHVHTYMHTYYIHTYIHMITRAELACVCTLGAIAAWLKLGWVGWYVYTHSHPCIWCMKVWMHTYVHTYVHTWIDTHIHTYIHACIDTYTHTYTHMIPRAKLAGVLGAIAAWLKLG
jgi:hypothetical protein